MAQAILLHRIQAGQPAHLWLAVAINGGKVLHSRDHAWALLRRQSNGGFRECCQAARSGSDRPQRAGTRHPNAVHILLREIHRVIHHPSSGALCSRRPTKTVTQALRLPRRQETVRRLKISPSPHRRRRPSAAPRSPILPPRGEVAGCHGRAGRGTDAPAPCGGHRRDGPTAPARRVQKIKGDITEGTARLDRLPQRREALQPRTGENLAVDQAGVAGELGQRRVQFGETVCPVIAVAGAALDTAHPQRRSRQAAVQFHLMQPVLPSRGTCAGSASCTAPSRGVAPFRTGPTG